jgi:hypothetical protein
LIILSKDDSNAGVDQAAANVTIRPPTVIDVERLHRNPALQEVAGNALGAR